MPETPMDVAYGAIVTDPTPATPSSHINPNAGMRKPQYMLNQKRPTKPGTIHNKPGVEIWAGSPFGKSECCPDTLTKQSPCWDGYVQRGMKPGDNGQMVPNCVPVEKTDQNSIIPTATFQDCQCETCKQDGMNCTLCPDCNNGMDAQTEMAPPASLGKMFFSNAKDFSKNTKTDRIF